ncbi:MAG: M67 family metallopeptidase [Erythrobacter sp.]
MTIEVSRDVMLAMGRLARKTLPLEACGILTGSGDHITGLIETDNVHPAPSTHFEIDPQALIDAHREARQGGPPIIGYFHSHPVGLAQPSAMDKLMSAGDGMIWAIATKREIGLFRAVEGGFEELCTQTLEG